MDDQRQQVTFLTLGKDTVHIDHIIRVRDEGSDGWVMLSTGDVITLSGDDMRRLRGWMMTSNCVFDLREGE